MTEEKKNNHADWHFIRQENHHGPDMHGSEAKLHSASLDDDEVRLSHKLAKELIQNTDGARKSDKQLAYHYRL